MGGYGFGCFVFNVHEISVGDACPARFFSTTEYLEQMEYE